MSHLLVSPSSDTGRIHHITPASANWGYVGFDVIRLHPGETISDNTFEREAILVLIEGKASVSAAGEDFGLLGERMSVFEQLPPHCVYVPVNVNWQVNAETVCELAVCNAPGLAKGSGKSRRQASLIKPAATETRGKGSNTRYINAIAMEDNDVADSLLVTEVFTPSGNWSSYPPHRHDEDDYPNMTYLEETYYHRLDPATGFAIQRVFTEDGSLDETMSVADRDVVLVPKGHHPCACPYGFSLYYLNVMAGPLRKWRFKNHPDFDWIAQRDA